MGKGTRNREKRREQASAPDVGWVLDRLGDVDDLETFRRLVAEHPTVRSGGILAALRAFQRDPNAGAIVALYADLLAGEPGEEAVTWAAFEDARAHFEHRSDVLFAEIDAIKVALDAGRAAEVVDRAEAAVAAAQAIGNIQALAVLNAQRGEGLARLTTGDREANLDAAVEAFETALHFAPDDALAAQILAQQGLAVARQLRGDVAENLAISIDLLRAALRLAEAAGDRDIASFVQTNLATSLVRWERGDRLANLQEAVQLCREALTWRSPERDAIDWAYTQLNLGAALEQLAGAGEADVDDAKREYAAVIDERGRGIDGLIGYAHFSLGRLHRVATEASPQEIAAAGEEDRLDELFDADDDLAAAREHLAAAQPLVGEGPDPAAPGRVLGEQARVFEALGEHDAAEAAARRAVPLLRNTALLSDFPDAAMQLGGLLARRGAWHEAASAYREAVEAAELAFHARLDTASRQRDTRRVGNLYRWAAVAIAQAGDVREAARVLEAGRARELRRRLGVAPTDAPRLVALPADLARAYRRAVAELAVAPLDADAAGAGRRLQEILTAIRGLDDYHDFGAAMTWETVAAATEKGWPLSYVNPTPVGTQVILVPHGQDPVGMFLPEPTSTQVFMQLFTGRPDSDDLDPSSPSYFGAISGMGKYNADDIAPALDLALPWIGAAIARPMSNLLSDLGACGATLVCSGPLGIFPLHAATWEEAGDRRALIDEYEIRYAASASLAQAALARARDRGSATPSLAAVSDPRADLPAAIAEVDEVARHFDERRVARATGQAAKAAFLRKRSRSATHVHIAGHARGGLFDAADAAIELADADLRALDITGQGQLHARLVVISACQSAQPELAVSDEAISIGNAMLAAGSACAIASLWPVDDAATALLMSRLYDEHFANGHRPPEALRMAQLWLRDLDEEAEARFLRDHPALDAHFERRAAQGTLPGRRAIDAAGPYNGRPYAHPDYWAPFIASGA